MNYVHVAFRLSRSLLQRIDRVQQAVEADPCLTAFTVTGRSATLRLAVEQGVQELEAQYKINQSGEPGSRGESRGASTRDRPEPGRAGASSAAIHEFEDDGMAQS